MGWIGCVRFEKFRCDFVARTFGPVRPVLHLVSWVNQTVPNAPKFYEMHQSFIQTAPKHEFRVQWGGLGAFFTKTSDATLWHELLHYLHQFSPFCTEFTIVTKHSQRHKNTKKCTKTWCYGPMEWIGCACCENFWCGFVASTFALIAPVQPVFHRVYCRNKIIPNAQEHYEMRQNISLGS